MSAPVGYRLTAKGRAALAELRERYEITPEGRAALADTTRTTPRDERQGGAS